VTGLRFPLRLERRFRLLLLPFGARPGNSYVSLDGDQLAVRFGFFGLELALSQVGSWEIGGPYRWWMALGVRSTPTVPEISFAGSDHGAVVLHLREPIRRWLWKRNLRDVYLAVDDLAALAAELARRGIAGPPVATQAGSDQG